MLEHRGRDPPRAADAGGRDRGRGRGARSALFFVGVWAVSGGGYFWPGWAILAVVAIAGGHARCLTWRSGGARRIAELESTRAGAVDAQDAELRRIERDLHDGAQARLVALGMSLGMAEQKLAAIPPRRRRSSPRHGAAPRRRWPSCATSRAASTRPCSPTVGSRRRSRRSPTARRSTSTSRSTCPRGPSPPVETAAYFVVAEALANAGKHAGARDASRSRSAGGRRARRRDRRTTAAAAPIRPGAGLRGPARSASRRSTARSPCTSPAGGPTHGPGGDSVRVVIAEDLALLRDGLDATAARQRLRGGRRGRGPRRTRPRGAARAAGHRDRRHPAAADLPRRRAAGGARAARRSRPRRRPDRLAVRRAGLCGGAARRRRRAASATC